jgi:hypothetical protein
VDRVPLAAIISMLRFLGIAHKIFINNIIDEPIILDSNNRSEDGDNDFYTGPISRTLDSRQLNRSTFNLETLYILSNYIISERDNDYNISNNETMLIAKR